MQGNKPSLPTAKRATALRTSSNPMGQAPTLLVLVFPIMLRHPMVLTTHLRVMVWRSNNFNNYADGGNGSTETFANYRDQANVGADTFTSYAKGSNAAEVDFNNYGKSFNEGTDTLTGYGKGTTGDTKVGFAGYDVNNTFKEYSKEGVSVSFKKYTNVSTTQCYSVTVTANGTVTVKCYSVTR